jgi:hypothetical protein
MHTAITYRTLTLQEHKIDEKHWIYEKFEGHVNSHWETMKDIVLKLLKH